MNDNNQKTFPENVVLIDAFYLNFVITDMKKHFEKTLNRTLPDINIPILSTLLLLDAGVAEEENEVQFFFIRDNKTLCLNHCHPSDLEHDLNGIAIKCPPFGEYYFASVSTEEMVSRGEFFIDLLELISNSDEVKRVIALPFNEEYGDDVSKALDAIKGKEVFQFRMSEPEGPLKHKWEILIFPLLQAFGVSPDEL